MPLLCISLLALLLLPLSLSCNSKSLPGDIQGDYIAIVQTDLVDTRNSTTALLQNTTCTLSHKPRNCTSNITNVVSNLHSLTCKMRNLELPHTNRLVESVLGSVRCSCPAKPTQDPQQNRTRRTRRRQRWNQKPWTYTKRLCKARVLLSTMTDCYEMLNSLLNQP